jgi:polysaccharide pyruvyl transferase WcaK-like protein
MKILLVQITNKNFGDSVIADNTRYLLNKIAAHSLFHKYEILDYAINTEDLQQVKYVDAIVFAGGGLVKFRQEKLYRLVSELITEAQKYNVPVFLNAVGVEGYDGDDERCLMLKEALNLPCVKGITIRDDIDCFRKNYVTDGHCEVSEVFDPAVWSQKTYGAVSRKKNEKKYIGLGIAREDLFIKYGIEGIDRGFLMKLWKEIAECLEARGYEWKIFTNGLKEDENFARDVLEEIGHGTKLDAPWEAKELVGNIAGMDGMIACRMHSNIIAYAYKIPSIGLVWNKKMTFWGQKCGYPERFIESGALSAETIVDALEKALAEGTKKPSRSSLTGTYNRLKRFVVNECKERKKEPTEIEVPKHLVAPALGGCDYKYKNLNSITQMKASLKHGYRYLELDVRMTADGELVCVNGWNNLTAEALGDERAAVGMNSEDFLKCSYWGHFPACSFDRIAYAFGKLPKEKNIMLILDVGKPKTETLELFYEKLADTLFECWAEPDRVMLRIQRERDLKAFAANSYPCGIIYFIPDESSFDKTVDFCRRKKISMVSMTEKTWTPELQKKFNEEKIKTLVLTYTKAGDVIKAIEEGAELVASHYYDVDYIQRLIF